MFPVRLAACTPCGRRIAVKSMLLKMWRETDGVLSFEWTVLTSLLTVGVVSGVAAVRDSTVDELGDVAQAMMCLDQSYYVEPPLVIGVHDNYLGWGRWSSTAVGSRFEDAMQYQDCTRSVSGNVKVREFNWKATGPEAQVPADATQ